MKVAEQQNRRKFPRFSDRSLAGAQVSLDLCAPFFGERVNGHLIDLSAGGMALLAPNLIPKKVFLKMSMTLPDGFSIESVITVRHVTKQKNHDDFLHGIEFMNLSPEMTERIQRMATEILACNDRTQRMASSICVQECTLNQICKRPQRVAKNAPPVQIQSAPADVKWPTATDVEDFFREAA